MKTKQLMFALVACAALFVASCDKDDDNDGVSGGGKVPTSVTEIQYSSNGKYERGFKNEYTYDSQNRVATSAYRPVDSMGVEIPNDGNNSVYTYEGDKVTKIVETEVEDNTDIYIQTFTYPSATEVQVISHYDRPDTSVYEMNEKAQLIKKHGYRYTYAADGTLAKREWFDDDATTPTDISVYTYDGKNGIYKNWNMPLWFMQEEYDYQNNIQQNMLSHAYSYTPNASNNRTDTYIIEYDSDNYPTKITEIMNGKVQFVRTIVYK